jgi:phosphodiesterase/alkaline phosphatase D-like protein
VTLTATGLEPGRRYRYDVEVDGGIDPARTGTVTTFPDGPADFSLVFGSCASTGSSGAVFDRMRELDPLLFLHLGDLHYADLAGDDDSARRSTTDRVLAAPAQAALHRSTTTAYVWDDHDFLGNDRGGLAGPAAGSALRVYRELVPHYPLPLGDGGPVAQAFTIGRVRFLVTDTRAGRDRAPGDGSPATMLGHTQRAWFESELRAAAERSEVVVWANPVPWIDPMGPGKDTWGGFADERQELADLIASLDVPLVMLSGDAHMLAIDDGTNSDYSASGGGGFPVFHAGALDRRGSVKGGPYSHGAFPGPGQFGLMEVRDDGTSITVEWSGRDWRGREIVRHRFELDPARGGGRSAER